MSNPPSISVDYSPQVHTTSTQTEIILPNPAISNHLNSPRRPSLSASIASSTADVHSGKTWAEKVEDPWLPLILTLDGGGIRGYSSLLILEKLMKEVVRWENYFEEKEQQSGLKVERRTFEEKTILPCHYFDFMYGTSTGGLIATMLARLRMTIPECKEYYKKVGNDLFGRKRSKIPLATKYHARPLEKAVQEIVAKHCPIHIDTKCGGNDWYPWHLDDEGEEPPYLEPYSSDSTDRICQSICLTATHNNRISEAYLLRTYNHQYTDRTPIYIVPYNAGAEKLRVWEVTRATSAAPFYFKELIADIENETKIFKDGGIRENNPSVAAWVEFKSLYGDEKLPALLLSVGTGRPNLELDGFAEAWPGPLGHLPAVKKLAETFAVFKNMLVKYTQGEQRHQDMVREARGEWNWYKRLNVSDGLQNMKLDNWERSKEIGKNGKKVVIPGGKSLKRMEDATEKYLRREKDGGLKEYAAPKIMLCQAAEKMVRQRRGRERAAKEDPRMKIIWDSYLGGNLKRKGGEDDEYI